MTLGGKPRTPRAPGLPPVQTDDNEARAARLDMEHRMRRAAMSRAKSQLTMPSLIKPAQTATPALKERLG